MSQGRQWHSERPERSSPPSALTVMALGLLASPGVAAWLATARARPAVARVVRVLSATLAIALAVVLFQRPIRWEVTTAIWVFFVGSCSLALALIAKDGSRPRQPAHHNWARATLRAVLPAMFFIPNLLVFSRLVGWWLTGSFQARLNPAAVDPEEFFSLIIVDTLWAVPLGLLFVGLSFRRGRLSSLPDLMLATGAWISFLILREVLVMGPLAALRTQMIGAEGFSSWAKAQELLLSGVLVVATVPLVLFLSWGPGRLWRRLSVVVVVLIATFVNISFVIGITARAQFGIARVYERSGDVASALNWYRLSLATNPTPAFRSYLQHRVGLLSYKLGDIEEAKTAFESVVTAHNTNESLASESSYYLDQLDLSSGGARVVLAGVEAKTELRSAYCAPNTLSLILGFWGRRATVGKLGEEIAFVGAGTSGSSIRFVVEEHGLEYILHPFSTLEDLRWLIDRGVPAIVYTPGHVLAVFGYDDGLRTVVAYDTAKWDIWVDRPYPDLLADWGRSSFLLGVVVPDDDQLPAREEILDRFETPRSRSAWYWKLAREQTLKSERVGMLKRALQEDPGFYPAAFDLLALAPARRRSGLRTSEIHEWLETTVDGTELLKLAADLGAREFGPVEEVSAGLGRWHHDQMNWESLVEVTIEASRSDLPEELKRLGGVAASRLGQWERAVFLLEGELEKETKDANAEALLALYTAHVALDQYDAGARVLNRVVGMVSDDRLEWTVERAEGLAIGRSPSYLKTTYSQYVSWRSENAEAQILLAEIALDAVDQQAPDDRRARLQEIRQAAHLAAAWTADDATRQRAEELLEGAGGQN